MKLVIFGVAGLVVGLAAGTGGRIATAKAAPATPAESVRHEASADSAGGPAGAKDAAGHGAVPDSGAARTAPAPSVTAVADSALEAPAHAARTTPAAPATAAGQLPAAEPKALRTAAAGATPPRSWQPLAKIFANMKPDEAVEVLQLLSDDEVEAVLRVTNVRTAAALLSKLPPERAAALGRRLAVAKGAS